jgi:hypothetical protein
MPFRKYIQNLFNILSKENKLNLEILKMIFNFVVIPNSGLNEKDFNAFFYQFNTDSNGKLNQKSVTNPSSFYSTTSTF